MSYLISTVPPTSSIFFFDISCSSLDTASLIGLGTPSTMSFASLSPRPVIALTTLMTWIFWSPKPVRIRVRTPSSPQQQRLRPDRHAAIMAIGAAADTPNFVSSSFTSFRKLQNRHFLDEFYDSSLVTFAIFLFLPW